MSKQSQSYSGFEQGPIRPPSEAGSLLLRLTRNCPWNRCTFCAVYEHEKFSLRPVEHIINDIDAIHYAITRIETEAGPSGLLDSETLRRLADNEFQEDVNVLYTAADWLNHGCKSVFLQDANSLVMKPDRLQQVLDHLQDRFPWVTRITSYARSHSINRISDRDLRQLARSGLNRIHIGMESGSDTVLQRIRKGVTKQEHVTAGCKVKQAGIELSEYVMPGLGGTDLSSEHALETADALNRIDADFIRLRTLAVLPGTVLHEQYRAGEFSISTDIGMVKEIRTLIGALSGIRSTIKSDHMRNLIQEVEGRLPDEQAAMLAVLDRFLEMPAAEQALFQLGRRMGYFYSLTDLQAPSRRRPVEAIGHRLDISPENADQIIRQHIRPVM